MYGRDTATTGRTTNQIAPAPPAPAGQSANARVRGGDAEQTAFTFFPFVLIAAVVLYIVYALLEQHEKLKSAIEPKAIGINFRNIAVMLVTVILGLNIFKIAAVKYSALTGGRFGGRLLVYLAGGA